MNRTQFYYQPSPIFSTIDWCWTFVVLLTGIIFWLEVTHFQWITLLFFIAFFIIAGLELLNRKILINKKALVVKDMFGRNLHQFNLKNNADDFSFTKRTVTITKRGQKHQFCLWPKDVRIIKKIVKAANE